MQGISNKVINPEGGAYKIVVTDGVYNPISHTVVFFQFLFFSKEKLNFDFKYFSILNRFKNQSKEVLWLLLKALLTV